ncbi:glycoside hydrolase family 57 protein [Thioalkalivibrio thiocyanodenitrificans]|uniref:glycoside hydrolase family 57 protein n=1 Tax=Thioalkalivibrio thiocyanodenitrificans TaxID=243063 RepID=UPI0003729842|nr:glycoside hydrolase family 57 protein [Thioalkalivibrio thiocyanodenitrificans]
MCAEHARRAAGRPLRVVLCWHMHQPQYRDVENRRYALPWTYLHAIKDYVDMAAHLEAAPDARAVVNFAPVLLEQIEDYAAQVRDHLARGEEIRDPLLSALAGDHMPDDPAGRRALAEACLHANHKHLIEPFPHFHVLVQMAQWLCDQPAGFLYQSEGFFADLVTWYHLAWLGETVRREDARVQSLMDKGQQFSLQDRRCLLEVIGEILGEVVSRYRQLAEQGRVELSFSPYAHPIVPLLLDLRAAREAVPDAPLPRCRAYPGGEERVRWHLERGLEVFERHFGRRPDGCWPSEGGVSTATLRLLAEYGIRWTASGENVLANSLREAGMLEDGEDRGWLHRPYVLEGADTVCFFRDDGLSDAIGFRYADWHADDAVGEFIHHLENIAAQGVDPDTVVSVILDGENAWEYYPANGYHFLQTLYARLSAHPGLQMTTFSECLGDLPGTTSLSRVVAGSWVHGSFSTWIGDAEKNRGWEMLVEAKQRLDAAIREGRLGGDRLEQALEQLAICEGSDWCWWFGDYNPASVVSEFERLYRHHLSVLYHLIDEPVPESLTRVFTHGGGHPAAGGTMRRGTAGHN